jgi:cob(I)alamin adenosyltransferase
MPKDPNEEFPRSDPAVTPDGPEQQEDPAPKRKGMVVIYHGDGAGKETAALGVLFRAHGRGLPVRHMRFRVIEPGKTTGDDLALVKLNVASDVITDASQAGGHQLWRVANLHLTIIQKGVLVLDGLLDTISMGWIPACAVVESLSLKSQQLHVIITGESAPTELLEVADLVSHMRAIKKRPTGATAIAGIDF